MDTFDTIRTLLAIRSYQDTTVPDAVVLSDVLLAALSRAGVTPTLAGASELAGVEAVRRGDVLFVLNHTDRAVTVPVGPQQLDLLTGCPVDRTTERTP